MKQEHHVFGSGGVCMGCGVRIQGVGGKALRAKNRGVDPFAD